MSAKNLLLWFLCHFGETVQLAQLNKNIRAELERRAEYALRYGVHAPSQFSSLVSWLPDCLKKHR